MTDKVIVTNLSALTSKYGANLKTIRAAVRDLIAADKKRGFDTRLVALDSKSAMKKLNAPAVTDPLDPEENKRAIDGVYKTLTPDYLLILGALDVVPHQDLMNPVYDGDDDPDRYAYSDLPYACEAAYSRKPQDFVGPTRVVGRLPDLTAVGDAGYLVGLLKTASSWRASPRADYERHLGISTDTWKISTGLSLKTLFGSSDDLRVSPPKGPGWTAAQLKRRLHFINCHGAEADFRFYGERKNDGMPIAHSARRIAGKISKGTVAAVECCYGSELYDPSLANGQMGICSTYLDDGAYGFVGSTTIAYGPTNRNEDADLVCLYFVRRVLAGASLGRAFLEARQEFAQSSAELDPFSIKTLAQFTLLGDPSIVPVTPPPDPLSAPRSAVTSKTMSASKAAVQRVSRSARRLDLAVKGLTITENKATAVKSTTATASPAMKKQLHRLATRARLRGARIQSFKITRPAGARRAERKAMQTRKAVSPSAFHVVLGRRRNPGPVPTVVGIVAKVVSGQIVSTRQVERR
jgi:hypothetical protein